MTQLQVRSDDKYKGGTLGFQGLRWSFLAGGMRSGFVTDPRTVVVSLLFENRKDSIVV